ncbi:MAG: 4-demethylwyosine synthase TYW1 [Nanoarchaeota archaeon]|nr:4-demethylwyosine synthase TYW1 [Nanoarchaeota archaeon]
MIELKRKTKMSISKEKIKDLERQGYRFVGRHSAVKVCEWCKKSLRGEDVCYKSDFYGIKSWQCVQMTPCFDVCSHRCIFCWRDINFTAPKWTGTADNPEMIIDECLKEHVKYLKGFGGNEKRDEQRYKEMHSPKHFAISLSGEPTFYPKMPELILALKKRGLSQFLVTNGTNPKMLEKMIEKKAYPTQLYVTLPAPNEEVYKKTCSPLTKGTWKKILKSLELLRKFPRTAIRLTMVKDFNMENPEEYSTLIKKAQPDFVEIKAYMWVGYSRLRLGIDCMPRHSEIKEFAEKIANSTGYKITAEKEKSRVVLLVRDDTKTKSNKKIKIKLFD